MRRNSRRCTAKPSAAAGAPRNSSGCWSSATSSPIAPWPAHGFAGFVVSRTAADEAEILSIAVAPEFRGAGVARRLLDVHLRRLAGYGVAAVFLEVDEHNDAGAPALCRLRLRQGRAAAKAIMLRPAQRRWCCAAISPEPWTGTMLRAVYSLGVITIVSLVLIPVQWLAVRLRMAAAPAHSELLSSLRVPGARHPHHRNRLPDRRASAAYRVEPHLLARHFGDHRGRAGGVRGEERGRGLAGVRAVRQAAALGVRRPQPPPQDRRRQQRDRRAAHRRRSRACCSARAPRATATACSPSAPR